MVCFNADSGQEQRAAPSAQWSQTRVGPPAGKLLICGGEDKKAMLSLFLQLVGDPSAPIVVIPTASVHSRIEENPIVRELKSLGAAHVTLLHTRDPKVANTGAFVEPLTKARGVWISGGRQWRLADAYLHTRTHQELFNLLDRGGIIGGSSAGASIQASYLVRGAPEGNHILMAPGHEEGFGFLRQTAIDQHVLARDRLRGLTEILTRRPDLLGIGIDEKAAIVVEGDQFEVVGESKVAVYDATRPAWPDDRPYILLSAGERYNLKHRRTPDAVGRDEPHPTGSPRNEDKTTK